MSPGFAVSVLATTTSFLVTLWLLYEDWAVYHSDKSGKPPGDNTITSWARHYEELLAQHHKTHWLVVFVLILGVCVGHLLWH